MSIRDEKQGFTDPTLQAELQKEILSVSHSLQQLLDPFTFLKKDPSERNVTGFQLLQRANSLSGLNPSTDALARLNFTQVQEAVQNSAKNYISAGRPEYFGPNAQQLNYSIFLKCLPVSAATAGCSPSLVSSYIEASKGTQKMKQELISKDRTSAQRMAFAYAAYSSKIIRPRAYNLNESAMTDIIKIVQQQLQVAKSSAQLRPYLAEFDVCALTYSRMNQLGKEAMQIISAFGLISQYETMHQKEIQSSVQFLRSDKDRNIDLREIRQFFIKSLSYYAKAGDQAAISKAFIQHHLNSYNQFEIGKGNENSAACLITQSDAGLHSMGAENTGVGNIISYALLCNMIGLYPCRQNENREFEKLHTENWQKAFIIETQIKTESGRSVQDENEKSLMQKTWQKIPEYHQEQNNILPNTMSFEEMEGGWDVQYGYGLPHGTTWTPEFVQKGRLNRKQKQCQILNFMPQTVESAQHQTEIKQTLGQKIKNALKVARESVFSFEYKSQMQFVQKYFDRVDKNPNLRQKLLYQFQDKIKQSEQENWHLNEFIQKVIDFQPKQANLVAGKGQIFGPAAKTFQKIEKLYKIDEILEKMGEIQTNLMEVFGKKPLEIESKMGGNGQKEGEKLGYLKTNGKQNIQSEQEQRQQCEINKKDEIMAAQDDQKQIEAEGKAQNTQQQSETEDFQEIVKQNNQIQKAQENNHDDLRDPIGESYLSNNVELIGDIAESQIQQVSPEYLNSVEMHDVKSYMNIKSNNSGIEDSKVIVERVEKFGITNMIQNIKVLHEVVQPYYLKQVFDEEHSTDELKCDVPLIAFASKDIQSCISHCFSLKMRSKLVQLIEEEKQKKIQVDYLNVFADINICIKEFNKQNQKIIFEELRDCDDYVKEKAKIFKCEPESVSSIDDMVPISNCLNDDLVSIPMTKEIRNFVINEVQKQRISEKFRKYMDDLKMVHTYLTPEYLSQFYNETIQECQIAQFDICLDSKIFADPRKTLQTIFWDAQITNLCNIINQIIKSEGADAQFLLQSYCSMFMILKQVQSATSHNVVQQYLIDEWKQMLPKDLFEPIMIGNSERVLMEHAKSISHLIEIVKSINPISLEEIRNHNKDDTLYNLEVFKGQYPRQVSSKKPLSQSIWGDSVKKLDQMRSIFSPYEQHIRTYLLNQNAFGITNFIELMNQKLQLSFDKEQESKVFYSVWFLDLRLYNPFEGKVKIDRGEVEKVGTKVTGLVKNVDVYEVSRLGVMLEEVVVPCVVIKIKQESKEIK